SSSSTSRARKVWNGAYHSRSQWVCGTTDTWRVMGRSVGSGFVEIAFGTDEPTAVTATVVDHLRAQGHHVAVLADGDAWPEVGRRVGEAVASGGAERGIVCCHTGTGVSIAANKVPGVRAALCTDAATAEGARRWNDANVLALG